MIPVIPFCILSIENEQDRTFMADLYYQYNKLMHSVIFQILRDQWATEDVMQNTLEKLIDRIADLRTKDRDHLNSYIVAACRNNSFNYLRSKKRYTEVPFEDHENAPELSSGESEIEEQFIKLDDLKILAHIWSQLDEKSRYVLEAYYILEKSSDEIARDLHIKTGSVRMALTRARRNAFRLFQKESEGE